MKWIVGTCATTMTTVFLAATGWLFKTTWDNSLAISSLNASAEQVMSWQSQYGNKIDNLYGIITTHWNTRQADTTISAL